MTLCSLETIISFLWQSNKENPAGFSYVASGRGKKTKGDLFGMESSEARPKPTATDQEPTEQASAMHSLCLPLYFIRPSWPYSASHRDYQVCTAVKHQAFSQLLFLLLYPN